VGLGSTKKENPHPTASLRDTVDLPLRGRYGPHANPSPEGGAWTPSEAKAAGWGLLVSGDGGGGGARFHGGDAVFHRALHLLERAHLDLAHALARDAELGG
jgi:hypothetical protein